MWSLSIDLRERIIIAVKFGKCFLRMLAEIFSVGLSAIVRLVRSPRAAGALAPPAPSAPDHAPAERYAYSTRSQKLGCSNSSTIVNEQPDATLTELRDRLDMPCSIMTIARALRRHNINRKKKSYHAAEQDSPRIQEQREQFQDELAPVDPNRLVFIDETAITAAMSRTHGRAPEGERAQATAPGAWQNITFI